MMDFRFSGMRISAASPARRDGGADAALSVILRNSRGIFLALARIVPLGEKYAAILRNRIIWARQFHQLLCMPLCREKLRNGNRRLPPKRRFPRGVNAMRPG